MQKIHLRKVKHPYTGNEPESADKNLCYVAKKLIIINFVSYKYVNRITLLYHCSSGNNYEAILLTNCILAFPCLPAKARIENISGIPCIVL